MLSARSQVDLSCIPNSYTFLEVFIGFNTMLKTIEVKWVLGFDPKIEQYPIALLVIRKGLVFVVS